MSGGGDGRRRTEFGTKTPKIVTQARVAAIQGGCGHAQGIGKPAAYSAGFGRENFAATDAVIRTKSQPGGKVPCGRKTDDLRADFAEEGKHGLGAQTRNTGQVHSEDSVHLGGDIEGGLIALSFVFGGGRLRALLLGIETREHLLDMLVAHGDLVLKMPVAFQGLLQAKDAQGGSRLPDSWPRLGGWL